MTDSKNIHSETDSSSKPFKQQEDRRKQDTSKKIEVVLPERSKPPETQALSQKNHLN